MEAASHSGPANILNMWRKWKAETAVKSTAIEHGQLMVSAGGKGHDVKATIKDAVRNKYALIPVLECVSKSDTFKLFPLKDAQREFLACYFSIFTMMITRQICFFRFLSMCEK